MPDIKITVSDADCVINALYVGSVSHLTSLLTVSSHWTLYCKDHSRGTVFEESHERFRPDIENFSDLLCQKLTHLEGWDFTDISFSGCMSIVN